MMRDWSTTVTYIHSIAKIKIAGREGFMVASWQESCCLRGYLLRVTNQWLLIWSRQCEGPLASWQLCPFSNFGEDLCQITRIQSSEPLTWAQETCSAWHCHPCTSLLCWVCRAIDLHFKFTGTPRTATIITPITRYCSLPGRDELELTWHSPRAYFNSSDHIGPSLSSPSLQHLIILLATLAWKEFRAQEGPEIQHQSCMSWCWQVWSPRVLSELWRGVNSPLGGARHGQPTVIYESADEIVFS